MERQPDYFAERVITAATGVVYGGIGAFAGVVTAEAIVLPIGFSEEYGALEQARSSTLENTRLPYDDTHYEIVTIGAAAGLLLGAVIGIVRARRKIRRQRKEDDLFDFLESNL